MRSLIWFFIGSVFWLSCSQDSRQQDHAADHHRIPVTYAKGFVIDAYADHYLVTVRDPLDTLNILAQYYLSRTPPSADKSESTIQIPVHRMVSLSTTHVGFLKSLNCLSALVGFSGTQYICDSTTQAMIASGNIAEVGNDGGLDHERLLSLHPDIVMTYQTGNAAYDQITKLTSLHLAPVINNEFKELSPLGQAEWIKFIAVFFDKLPEAESQFAQIEAEYLQLKKMAQQVTTRPAVFTGLAFKGEWTIPGGKSFAAQYFADAGADYVWKENDQTGNVVISLSSVMERGLDADYWLHPGAAVSLQEIAEADSRYTHFKAWKSGVVYNNNARQSEKGGNDYWEYGIVYPNVVLRDLIYIFHPELLPNHVSFFYTQLH